MLLSLPPSKGSRDAQARHISSDLGVLYHHLPTTSVVSHLPQLLANSNRSNGNAMKKNVDSLFAPSSVLYRVLRDMDTVAEEYPELRVSFRIVNRLIKRLAAEDAPSLGRGSGEELRALLSQVFNVKMLSGKASTRFQEVLDKSLGEGGGGVGGEGGGGGNKRKKTTATATVPRAAETKGLEVTSDDAHLQIGEVVLMKNRPRHPENVPRTLFHYNSSQLLSMQSLMRDYMNKEKAVLLIGNQGVGKNKIVDKFLELMRIEREYIQLHRDTTLQALTSLPVLQDGRITYEDSPMIRAAKLGRALVIDEADKAPLEVSCCLKGLAADGELILSDGRRLLSQARFELEGRGGDGKDDPDTILIHPDFFLIVLGNLPGFPFLGNDFFREIGDVFSTHVIENLDIQSEIQLLKAYAPNVSMDLVTRLAIVFVDLRSLHKEGSLAYPFSARECVSIVKHLESFPSEHAAAAIENVIAFDSLVPSVRNQLVDVFRQHGFDISSTHRTSDADLPLNQRRVISKRRVPAEGEGKDHGDG